MKKIPVIIDTDAGADDLLALILALRHPALTVCAIVTSYGNFTEAESHDRVLALQQFLSLPNQPSIIRGFDKSIYDSQKISRQIHGSAYVTHNHRSLFRNITGVSHFKHSTKTLLSSAHDQSITYITLGPMTNAAHLLSEPLFCKKIKHIYSMGGTLFFPGNATLTAEANFYWDPWAVEKVLHGPIPIYLTPLNISQQLQLTPKRAKPLLRLNFFNKILQPYMNYYVRTKKQLGASLHDVIPVISLINKSAVAYRKTFLSTQEIYNSRGMIVPLADDQLIRGEGFVQHTWVATAIDLPKSWSVLEKYVISSHKNK